MTTNATLHPSGVGADVVEGAPEPSTAAEQLSLLPTSSLPLQFRLSRATRERGLAHIAAIRTQLAQRAGPTEQVRDGAAA